MTDGAFCADCFSSAQRIVSPCCERCGTPLVNEAYGGARKICVSCQLKPPAWRKGRAAFVYDDWSRRIILPLKYSDQTENATVLSREMERAGVSLLEQATLLVPVPMYRGKLWRRRYNQAALLARGLARHSKVPALLDGLERRRATRPLARLSPKERHSEIADTIIVRAGRGKRIAGQAVLLVDDVLTTGATASVCTDALLKAGALSVDILVAARTGRGDERDVPYPEE
ncbi:amidophosphoribosyltransferase [Gluconobacter oxydans]|nr:competence protein F [Gluconobacter oxydans H24]ANQ42395.1 amidophosphoribosyltransferase [Gluconobacter oxydans]